MAVSAKWYGLGVKHVAENNVKFSADTIKVSLHTSTYSPNQDTHDFFDDATNEVSGTGYTAGGITLANKAVTYDSATNELRLDADDISWPSSTITARFAVIRKARGGAASADEILGYVDFGGDQSTSGTTFAITWDATGVLKLTAA